MDSFLSGDSRDIFLAIVKTIQDNAAYLSELDGAIGDGDHGVNMSKGFTSFQTALGNQAVDLSTGFLMLGTTLLTEIGGAMGPLYGTLFITMGDACAGKSMIDRDIFGDMLAAGRREVQDVGGAGAGDKTLMDTLIPAQIAYSEAVEKDARFTDALQAMVSAAQQGQQSTHDLIAKLGRASRLG
ncbi:MAG TPA: dihydroxyacetone kinase subunit DhaL, partial [Aggregatilineales bacterium]|nr:dihydroxyacetone kinase subunit DhaL [Aggregatilineales bacterium]